MENEKKMCADCAFFTKGGPKAHHCHCKGFKSPRSREELPVHGQIEVCKVFWPKGKPIPAPLKAPAEKPHLHKKPAIHRKPHIRRRPSARLHAVPKQDIDIKCRDIHKGEEIWVLGCGPSLDDYPEDFFDDKIAIACKGAAVAFPNARYFITSVGTKPMKSYLIHRSDFPDVLSKCIFIQRTTKPRSRNWAAKFKKSIFMKGPRRDRASDSSHRELVETARSIMRKRPCNFPCIDSIVHWAIQAAAIMGAKQITLAGCEERGGHAERTDLFYSASRKMRTKYGGKFPPDVINRWWHRGQRQRSGNRWLAEGFKPFGVKIIKYTPKREYQNL